MPQRSYYIPQSGYTLLNGTWDFKFYDCDFEEAYIEKWVNDFGFGMDVIEIALKKTTSKTNPSFDYIDKIISDWHERKLTTEEQITTFMKEQKQKQKDFKHLMNLEKKSTMQMQTMKKLWVLTEVALMLTNTGTTW